MHARADCFAIVLMQPANKPIPPPKMITGRHDLKVKRWDGRWAYICTKVANTYPTLQSSYSTLQKTMNKIKPIYILYKQPPQVV